MRTKRWRRLIYYWEDHGSMTPKQCTMASPTRFLSSTMTKILFLNLFPLEVCDDQIRIREKREQEKEKIEAPKRNRKKKSDTLEKKSDTHERKSGTHERKFNYLAKASEVRKALLAREPLYLLYCKDSKISTDNSNELTISVSPIVELLLQKVRDQI